MNKENFVGLCRVLSAAGLLGLEHTLLQYLCCRPVNFTLSVKLPFGASDLVRCDIRFERKGSDYQVMYYDAALTRETSMPEKIINQVSLLELEEGMQVVDWLGGERAGPFRFDEESTWVREKAIDGIIGQLSRLSVSEEGKLYADILKVRFWTGTLLEELTGSLAAVRSKLEVSQRFYFVGGEGIVIEQAYRFLLNRWIEKRMSVQRREKGSGGAPVADSQLLKKKRIGKGRKSIE